MLQILRYSNLTSIQVVAVLLDNFVRAVSLEKMKLLEELEDARMRTLGVSKARGASPLDPLLEVLSRFKNSVLLFSPQDFSSLMKFCKFPGRLKSTDWNPV